MSFTPADRDPVLAIGRSDETTLNGAATADDLTFTVNSASGWSDSGADHAFCSEGDDTGEFEYLGLVTDVSGSVITVDLGFTAQKANGSNVWTATSAVRLPNQATTITQDPDDGREIIRTLDNQIHRVQIRDAIESLSLTFSGIEKADFQSLMDFLTDSSKADRGDSDFVFATWDYENEVPLLATVRLMNLNVPGYNASIPRHPGFRLDLQIIDNEYPA